MFNSPILDVALGLVFIFLLYSLLASIIQEMISTYLSLRSKILEKAIIRMLEDEDPVSVFKSVEKRMANKAIAQSFYKHPLIKYLSEKDNRQPSYLSANNFSKVMIDMLKNTSSITQGVKQLDANISNGQILNGLPLPTDTKAYIQSLWADAKNDTDVFKQKLEQWFDDTMERASGWYKKKIQVILFFIGLALAITFNVDTISIVKRLSKDPKIREQMVAAASNYLQKNKDLSTILNSENVDDSIKKQVAISYQEVANKSNALMDKADTLLKNDVRNANQLMGLGWDNGFLKLNEGQDLTFILGFIITALAISLGAPFWFDMLNKLMKLRGSGNKIDGSADNKKKLENDKPISPVNIYLNNQSNTEDAVG